jgi:hypothetical protein
MFSNGYCPNIPPRPRLAPYHPFDPDTILTNINQRLNTNDLLLASLKTSEDALETLDLILAFKANIKRSLKELEQLPLRSGGGVMPEMIENKDSEREINHKPQLIPKTPRKSSQQHPFTVNTGQASTTALPIRYASTVNMKLK